MRTYVKGVVIWTAAAVVLFGGVGIASALTETEALAQIQSLMSQIQAMQSLIQNLKQQQQLPAQVPSTYPGTTSAGASGCASLERALSRGARGNDVLRLQQFLTSQGIFFGEATGYFGSLTERAVQEFQDLEGIVSSGKPSTTGFGAVGPRTRNAINTMSCNVVGQNPGQYSAAGLFPTAFVGQQPAQQSVFQSNCVLNGASYIHGATISLYAKSLVEPSENCLMYLSNRQCLNGILTGDAAATYTTCQQRQSNRCYLNSFEIPSGSSRTFYSSTMPPAGTSCSSVSQVRTCYDGVLSGTSDYWYGSCTDYPAGTCVLGSTPVLNGATSQFYTTASAPAGQRCSAYAQNRTCANGLLSGSASYSYPSCIDSQSCTLDGITVASNATTTFFTARKGTYSVSCTSLGKARGCVNGTLGGDTAYVYGSCAEAAPTLTASSTISQGQPIRVSFSESPGLLTDRIGIYASGETDQNKWKDWEYTSSGTKTTGVAITSGTLTFGTTFSLSLAVGTYEARFFKGGTSVPLATAVFTVNAGDPCTLDGATVAHNSSATFYSSRTAPYGGSCNSLKQQRTCTTGTLSGSSAYQYSSCSVGTPAVSTSKSSYKQGETITANFSSGTGASNDWIGIFVSGETSWSSRKDWNYVGGSKTLGSALVSGSVNLTGTVYLVPGNYEARFYRGSDNALLASNSFAMTAGDSCVLDGATVAYNASATFYSSRTASYVQGCASLSRSRKCVNGTFDGDAAYQYTSCTTGVPSLVTDKSSYKPGDPITFTFSNGSGNAKDRINLLNSTGSIVDWRYVDATQVGLVAKESGTITLSNTLNYLGTYSGAFYKYTAGGSVRIATTTAFTIAP